MVRRRREDVFPNVILSVDALTQIQAGDKPKFVRLGL